MAKAEILHIHPEDPQGRLIDRVVEVLRKGGIVVHPTDTTYALGVDMNNKRGVEMLYQIKKKSLNRPLSFLCKDLSNISEYAMLSNSAFRTMKRLLPGPYTFILNATKSAPHYTQGNNKEIGIRVPAEPICHAILDRLDHPLVSTSAYVHGGDLLADPEEIQHVLGGHADLIIDAGYIWPEPSTIISFVDDEPTLIREGKGPFEAEMA
ncbi:MAG: threonylcarbamoyl-AMP synthase [Deltaproteobacteria bacterium]|nr:threonylcarbamoyl-AMP synthase [bacterium]MCB9478811.1 threonylcarbamoyl-AMP synthase [Deltaproteobacteria bacterium]MCB9489027.1 threonylcarbamoyl-AMP synthase [Deltaproteobacteria bacterium]